MVESNIPKLLESDSLALLSPSGDTSGVTDRTVIVEALASSTYSVIYLLEGTYYLDQAISVPSSKYLGCPFGLAIVKPTFTGSGADNRTNAVFLVQGTVTGSVNTTISANAYMGDGYIKSTASVSSSLAGSWLRMRGVNTAGTFSGDNSTAIISEIIQIASGFAGGTQVTLNQLVKVNHMTGTTLQSLTPVVDATLEGIWIDSSDNSTIAVGVLVEDAARITLKRIWGSNLSRAVVSAYGSCHLTFEGCGSRGSTNCTLLRETCQHFRSHQTTRTAEGNRAHAAGIPRPELTMRAMCVSGMDDGGEFSHCVGVLRQWGGINNFQSNITAHDVDCTLMISRDTNLTDHLAVGSVFDGGPSDATAGEYHYELGFGCGISNITATSVRHQDGFNPDGGGTIGQFALHYKSHRNFRATNVAIDNMGRDSAYVGFYLSGIMVSDCTGFFAEHTIRGAQCGLYSVGTTDNTFFDGLSIYATAGETPHALIPLGFYFNNSGGFQTSLHFDRVRMVGYSADWAHFGSSFNDRWLVISYLTLSGRPFSKVKPFTSSETSLTVAEGILGVLTESAPELSRATGPDRRNVVFAGVPHNGWVLAAMGDSTLVYTSTAPSTGNTLVANSTGSAIVSTNQPLAAVWYLALAPGAASYVHAERRSN